MSLNSSVPQPLNKSGKYIQVASPDYVGLVRFLIQPFLESADSLSVDCEMSPTLRRAWIRLAFEGADKGRVFGRGGRNIQAIRTVIEAVAAQAGHSVYLDIYGSTPSFRDGIADDDEAPQGVPSPKSRERRSNGPRHIAKPRTRSF
ncbi:MAG: KH domain-containing protein [Nostocaceae cyanobacterium]|nr:KH domain-containing protein [Nostocaceae cyanobacterium]